MSTSESRLGRLMTDDRGAIMVMGIFMCSCLVASLWYLAGIGDAILYRERLQEAADAVAFSDAALHARGMNLIVLINLVMAVILGIRVALRVGKLVMTVAAAMFAALGFLVPALWAAAAPTAAAAVTLNTADNATKSVIDGALRGLNVAQEAIARTTPGLAQLAAEKVVGPKYGVAETAVLSDPSVKGLPVEKRKPSKLCGEAATVIPKIGKWFFDKAGIGALGAAMDVIAPLLKALAESDSQYFCDLEAGASEPNTDKQFGKAASDRCDEIGSDKEEQHLREAEKRWEDECAKVGVQCTSRDPKGDRLAVGLQAGAAATKEQQATLDSLRLERDLSVRSVSEVQQKRAELEANRAKCLVWAMNDLKGRRDAHKKQNEQQQSSSSSSSSSSGIGPMLVKDFRNGSDRGQLIAGVTGDHVGLRRASKIVRIGAFHDKRTRPLEDTEAAQMPAWAQAELFYGCGAKWKEPGCDDDDESMWHFRWRARLRRFNQPPESTLAQLAGRLGAPAPTHGHERFADALARDALAPGSPGLRPNGALRVDLKKSVLESATRTHGVH